MFAFYFSNESTAESMNSGKSDYAWAVFYDFSSLANAAVNQFDRYDKSIMFSDRC